MQVVNDLIHGEAKGGVSFGDFSLAEKQKKSDFEYGGDVYKVKTFSEITKLEKNGMFEYESVPGTAVFGYVTDADSSEFQVTGKGDTQIVIGVEEGSTYRLNIDGEDIDEFNGDFSGKVVFNVELDPETPSVIRVVKR